jgi:hypothetical protein
MPVSNMENQNSKNYLAKTTEQIVRNLDNINRPGVQLNVNSSAPLKVNISEVMRERRDGWEQANFDKSTDKAME